jgi:hypothetical protein
MKYSKHGYKRNSKDRNNPYNVIPSGNITMEGVDFPVMGTDNLGNQKLMMPGANYIFPGNEVFEVPLAQTGGSTVDPGQLYNNQSEFKSNNNLLFPEVSTKENPIHNDRNLGALIYYTPEEKDSGEADDGSGFFTSDLERMIPYLNKTYGEGNWKSVKLPKQEYNPRYTELNDLVQNHPSTIKYRDEMDKLHNKNNSSLESLYKQIEDLQTKMTNTKDDEEFKRLDIEQKKLYSELEKKDQEYAQVRRDFDKNYYDSLETEYPDLHEARVELQNNYSGNNALNRYVSAENIANKYFSDVKNLKSDGNIFVMQHGDSRIGPLTMAESYRDEDMRSPEIIDTFGEILLPESQGGWLSDNNSVVCYGGMCSGSEGFKRITEASGVTTHSQPGTWSGYQPSFGDDITEQYFNTNEEGIINPNFDGGAYITHALNDGNVRSDTIGVFSPKNIDVQEANNVTGTTTTSAVDEEALQEAMANDLSARRDEQFYERQYGGSLPKAQDGKNFIKNIKNVHKQYKDIRDRYKDPNIVGEENVDDLSNWQKIKNVVNWRENLAENLNPRGYHSPVERLYETIVLDRARPGSVKGPYSRIAGGSDHWTDMERQDLLQIMLNKPQVHNSIEVQRAYWPTNAKENPFERKRPYYKSNRTEMQIRDWVKKNNIKDILNTAHLDEEIENDLYSGNLKELISRVAKDYNIKEEELAKRDAVENRDQYDFNENYGHVLGNYTMDYGIDPRDGREYISYYDKWNINPTDNISDDLIDKTLNLQSPEIYGRVYLDDIDSDRPPFKTKKEDWDIYRKQAPGLYNISEKRDGGSLPKAQAGFDMLQNHQIAAQLREKGIDPDAKGSDLSPFSDVPPTGGVSNLLDILSVPGNLMAEVFEGVGGYGDKEFNFKDAMPGFSGDFSFTNMYDEPTKTVADVTDVQGFVPSLLVNVFTDPTSYIGVGLLGKTGTVAKGASKTSKVINATDDLAVASKNTPTNITKPAAETIHTPGSVHDYLTKYWNDPKFQKYQTTEMVRNARQYNDDMMMRNLYFKQRQDGVDLALKYGHNHPIVQNYHKQFVDPWPTYNSFYDNYPITVHDKINYRSSFNDIINRQTRFGNQNMDFLNQKFKPRTFDELMDPKLLDRNYFNLLFDQMRTPTGQSSLQTFKNWIKDNRKTLGLYYQKNHLGYLRDKIYIKDMLTSPRLLTKRIQNPTAYSDQIKSTKIHEWSHYLDKSGTTFSNKQLDDLVGLASPSVKKMVNDIMNEKKLKGVTRFSDDDDLIKNFFYYTKPTEIKARMMELRNNFNLLPSDRFTMEHLNKSGDMFGMRPFINVDSEPELFLDIMNKYYREGGENEVDFDQLERGIKYAESLNGELMQNKNSSASGFYGQLFSEIEDEYDGTREDFIKDVDYQLELFTKRANGELEDVPGLISNGTDLYSEYQDQLDLSKHGLNPLTIAGLSNMLGRQGTREYIGYVLRDGKTIEEVFPHLYGENAEYPNHTPDEYIAKFNKGLITKKEGGSTLRKVRRIKQQLKKYKEGKEISYIAKKELINLGLIDNQLTPNQSVR